MGWWDDDWRPRKKKTPRRGYWDDIFERMLDDINAMFRDFTTWPDFPDRLRQFLPDEDNETTEQDSEIRGPFVYGFKYSLGPDGKLNLMNLAMSARFLVGLTLVTAGSLLLIFYKVLMN